MLSIRWPFGFLTSLCLCLSACGSNVGGFSANVGDPNAPSFDGSLAVFSCQGAYPDNASLCSGDNKDLSAHVNTTIVSSCTSEQKCEYQCDAGFILQSGSCVLNPAAGDVCEATGDGRCFYVSPSGSDSNNGGIDQPFASTNPIIEDLRPGDFIYFRDGRYGPKAKGQIARTGSTFPEYHAIAFLYEVEGGPDHPITFKAYPGEKPVFDMYEINPECNPTALTDCARDAFSTMFSSHIRFQGFEIIHGGIRAYGSSYITIEDNHIHDLYATRSNNGLVVIYFSRNVTVRNNELHDTYERKICAAKDKDGKCIAWKFNDEKSHEDGQHNGCITTLSGDVYSGYGHSSTGAVELLGNDVHDCPIHLFIKNQQGQVVFDETHPYSNVNLLIKDNHFYGEGDFAGDFKASNALIENNLIESSVLVRRLGSSNVYNNDEAETVLNEINARNVWFRHNVIIGPRRLLTIRGLGFLLPNGVYSNEMEDKLHFIRNAVVMSEASAPGNFGWNQGGYLFGNSYSGMLDTDPDPAQSLVLGRIHSEENCFINSEAENIAFFKHWTEVDGEKSMTGYDLSDAVALFGLVGEGDIFPSDTSLASHFMNPASQDYSIKESSNCASNSRVGLINAGVFSE